MDRGGAVIIAALLASILLPIAGCQTAERAGRGDDARPSLVARAQEFRSRLEQADYEAARAMMADDARRWWEKREGEGRPWRIGPEHRGPWAAWDEHFRSRKEVVEWKEGPRSATVVIRETNDYFQLLERGWVTNEVVYYFDQSALIDGLVIRGVGERPPGRTEEFLSWASEHAPEELAELMPAGEIDPSGDHPRRFRRLLNRWRSGANQGSMLRNGSGCLFGHRGKSEIPPVAKGDRDAVEIARIWTVQGTQQVILRPHAWEDPGA